MSRQLVGFFFANHCSHFRCPKGRSADDEKRCDQKKCLATADVFLFPSLKNHFEINISPESFLSAIAISLALIIPGPTSVDDLRKRGREKSFFSFFRLLKSLVNWLLSVRKISTKKQGSTCLSQTCRNQ